MFSEDKRSVSRVPGAPPRCDTPPTAPVPSTSTTVQPVGRSASVKDPTLMPATAVMPLEFDGAGAAAPGPAARPWASNSTSVPSPRANAALRAAVHWRWGIMPLLFDSRERLRQPAGHDGGDVGADITIRQRGVFGHLAGHSGSEQVVYTLHHHELHRLGLAVLAPGQLGELLGVRQRHLLVQGSVDQQHRLA